MKRFLFFGIIILLLSGCFYDKEAKQLKNDKAVQQEIVERIKEKGIEQYGMELEVNINRLQFTYPEGKIMLPFVKSSKRLEVPVRTVGEPVFHFPVFMSIYDQEE